MGERKEDQTKTEAASPGEKDRSPESIRRDFIKRFGAYAAGTSTGLFVLMSARTSKAPASDGADY